MIRKDDRSEVENTHRKNNVHSPPLAGQRRKHEPPRERIRASRTQSDGSLFGSSAMLRVPARHRSPYPAPPPRPFDSAIPLSTSLSDPGAFIPANKTVSANDNIRSRYLHKLRIPSHAGKVKARRKGDATAGAKSKPVTIRSSGWAHARRRVSAPPPVTPPMGPDAAPASSAAKKNPAPQIESDAIQLDLGLMFGEESPMNTRHRSYSATDDFIDEDDDMDHYRANQRAPRHFSFVPPHELARRTANKKRSGTAATDSTEEELMFIADSSTSPTSQVSSQVSSQISH